jgi:putative ABC transport system permease protein
MLLFKTAIKNILGAGRRTWLNVTVLSFIFVLMTGFNGLIDGWVNDAITDTRNWEAGDGQFWHENYDRYDLFTLQDAHGPIPRELIPSISDKSLTPVLVIQAVAYEAGNMQNVLLRGIDPSQQILEIPSGQLQPGEDHIKAIIGKRMARTLNARVGDNLLVRWRDKNGAFDAQEIVITGIFDTSIATVDAGQVWVNLHQLQQMTGMEEEATYLVRSPGCSITGDVEGWKYKGPDFLLEDLYIMARSSRVESFIIFTILLSIALLAVFDTQTLSIFRRQKEIGTYIALGMTPKQVTRLFTLEGTAYSILAILAGTVWGTPLLYWYGTIGIKLPQSYTEMGLGMRDTMLPVYQPGTILASIVIIVSLSMLISYLPARKIAKSNVVEALKGKIN